MQEKVDQNNSEYRHFLPSIKLLGIMPGCNFNEQSHFKEQNWMVAYGLYYGECDLTPPIW